MVHQDCKFCMDAFGSLCFDGCKAIIESSVFQHGLFVALQRIEPEVPLQSQGLSSGIEQVVRAVCINSWLSYSLLEKHVAFWHLKVAHSNGQKVCVPISSMSLPRFSHYITILSINFTYSLDLLVHNRTCIIPHGNILEARSKSIFTILNW